MTAISELDILVAINGALQEEFKGELKIYGREVSDGYKTPSLFTEIVTSGTAIGTKCHASMQVSGRVTYFEKMPDSIEELKLFNRVKKALGKYLEVGDRKLTIHGYSTSYTGERNNILQVAIDFGNVVIWIRDEEEGYSAMENVNVELKEE